MRRALLATLALLGCGKSGTYVVVRVESGPALAVTRLEVTLTLEGRTARRTLEHPGGTPITLPTTVGFEIVGGEGAATAAVIARDAQGNLLAEASAGGVVERGETTTITVGLGPPVDGGVDAALPDADLTDAATPDAAAHNLVFATSIEYPANLGGLTGADEICRQRAERGGLPGTYRAWLSATGVNARDRLVLPGTLQPARGFMRPDGRPVADQVSDLTVGNLLHAPSLDEFGQPVRGVAWTGTNLTGTVLSSNCQGWTSTADGPASYGDIDSVLWSYYIGHVNGCAVLQNHVLCFAVDRDRPPVVLAPPPANAKKVFVTRALFQPGPGKSIQDAHDMCRRETIGALPGTFRALLSTTSAPAASFLVPSTPYHRPDGVLVGLGSEIAAARLRSGIWQHADGVYLRTVHWTWTGSSLPSRIGTDAETCHDWSDDTMPGGHEGDAASGDSQWWDTSTSRSCPSAYAVYCVEQ